MSIKAETYQGRYSINRDQTTNLSRSVFICNKCDLGHMTLIGTEDEFEAEIIIRDMLNEHWEACQGKKEDG